MSDDGKKYYYSDCYMDPVFITTEELRKAYGEEFWEHHLAEIARYKAEAAAWDAAEAEKSDG